VTIAIIISANGKINRRRKGRVVTRCDFAVPQLFCNPNHTSEKD